jgi:D-alanyl-D-alanine carboxypeptidase (penicillin-binding protein 5/6)
MSLFIYHMNAVAKALRLRNTRFANPHGLMNKKNYSCSDDLTKLCIYAMQREDFRRIVAKRQHNCTIYNRKYASQREVIWNNTNKLLKLDGFVGIKTGITPSAGPCLASCFSISPT